MWFSARWATKWRPSARLCCVNSWSTADCASRQGASASSAPTLARSVSSAGNSKRGQLCLFKWGHTFGSCYRLELSLASCPLLWPLLLLLLLKLLSFPQNSVEEEDLCAPNRLAMHQRLCVTQTWFFILRTGQCYLLPPPPPSLTHNPLRLNTTGTNNTTDQNEVWTCNFSSSVFLVTHICV